jgi:ribosomal protein S18 acetylase RimI-like enzyme
MGRPTLRAMRMEDLRSVFILGTDLFAGRGSETAFSWNERDLAGILAGSLDLCVVAIQKKTMAGFCIGTILHVGGAPTGRVLWLGVREDPRRGGLASDLLSAFVDNLSGKSVNRVTMAVSSFDKEIISAIDKIGFTERGHVLIMEALFPK